MRKSLLTAIFGLALAAPAFAQNTNSSTMNPPAPNAGVGTVETTNSLPAGAGTATTELPGSALGTSQAASPRSAGAVQVSPPPVR